MLKISLIETSAHCRVVLEGRMAENSITKLMKMYARLKSELNGRTLIVDLKDIILMTREGENALLEFINHGAKIRPEGVLVKHILQQLAHRSRKQVSDLVDASLGNREENKMTAERIRNFSCGKKKTN